jgi:hypothetical protein
MTDENVGDYHPFEMGPVRLGQRLGEVIVAIEPELLDKKTTCQVLGGISEDRLEAFMRAGEIVPRLVGKRVVFAVEEVRRFARSRPSWEPRSGS